MVGPAGLLYMLYQCYLENDVSSNVKGLKKSDFSWEKTILGLNYMLYQCYPENDVLHCYIA